MAQFSGFNKLVAYFFFRSDFYIYIEITRYVWYPQATLTKILLCMYLSSRYMVFFPSPGRERFKKSSLYVLSWYIVRCSIILVLDIGWFFSLFWFRALLGTTTQKFFVKDKNIEVVQIQTLMMAHYQYSMSILWKS